MRRLWRGGEIGVLEHRRQETYDVVEIGLIINAGDPGLIGGARMCEREGSDEHKGQQQAQASGTRAVQATESRHSRLV